MSWHRSNERDPAEFSATISVDAGDFPSELVFRFCRDFPIEFVARGDGVEAPARGGGYTVQVGTSFATPAITGLCALLLGDI